MNSKRVTNAQDPVSAQDVATKNYVDTYYMKQVKVERFTASGTFTPPAGSSYAIAHIRGGGGAVSTGIGATGPAVDGEASSVAFASGTITASGGQSRGGIYIESGQGTEGATNSGQGGFMYGGNGFGSVTPVLRGADGAEIVGGGAITPGVGIAVVVGAGGQKGPGSASGFNGGSGYVWIEYY